jgi:hypothetical protein
VGKIGTIREIDRAKDWFFDRKAVLDRVDRARVKSLSRFGAFVRTRARSLIRTRKRVSRPGEPPSSHTGVLKRFIYFVYDPVRKTVVVGPAKTNQLFHRGGTPGVTGGAVFEGLTRGPVPGKVEVFKAGRWQRADLRSRRRLAGLPLRTRWYKVAARPYMVPALLSVRRQFIRQFRGSMGG